MSSSQSVSPAQRSAFALDLNTLQPAPPTQVPATVEPPKAPRVPMGTRAKAKLAAFQATAFGEGLGIWLNKVGSVAGYVVPAAVAAGAAYAVGGMDGSQNSAVVGALAWGIGGLAATIFTNTAMNNVTQYRKEGHTHPRLASFRDIMSYFILPTAVAGWGLSEHLTGANAALWLGPAVGAVTASVGIQVLSVRKKRVR